MACGSSPHLCHMDLCHVDRARGAPWWRWHGPDGAPRGFSSLLIAEWAAQGTKRGVVLAAARWINLAVAHHPCQMK